MSKREDSPFHTQSCYKALEKVITKWTVELLQEMLQPHTHVYTLVVCASVVPKEVGHSCNAPCGVVAKPTGELWLANLPSSAAPGGHSRTQPVRERVVETHFHNSPWVCVCVCVCVCSQNMLMCLVCVYLCFIIQGAIKPWILPRSTHSEHPEMRTS